MSGNTPYRLLVALRVGIAALGLIAIAAVAAAAAATAQKTFATPAAAVDALIAANRGNHLGELLTILGPDSAKLIHSGDPVADEHGRTRFVAHYMRGTSSNSTVKAKPY